MGGHYCPPILEGNYMESNIKFLLDYCHGKEKLYNEISNKLYIEFGLQSAELTLLCTFIANEHGQRLIQEIKNIYYDNKFPEDVEIALDDWLKEKG